MEEVQEPVYQRKIFFLKLQLNTTTRKMTKEPHTMEELKSVIEESLSINSSKYNIYYEDDSKELVNVLDDKDLETCYIDAEYHRKAGFKIVLLKEGQIVPNITDFDAKYGIQDFESDSEDTEDWEIPEESEETVVEEKKEEVKEEKEEEKKAVVEEEKKKADEEKKAVVEEKKPIKNEEERVEKELSTFKVVEKKKSENIEEFKSVNVSEGPDALDKKDFPELNFEPEKAREQKKKQISKRKKLLRKFRKNIKKGFKKGCKKEKKFFREARKVLRKLSKDAKDFFKV